MTNQKNYQTIAEQMSAQAKFKAHVPTSPYETIESQAEQIEALKARVRELASNEARLIALVDDLMAEREAMAA